MPYCSTISDTEAHKQNANESFTLRNTLGLLTRYSTVNALYTHCM